MDNRQNYNEQVVAQYKPTAKQALETEYIKLKTENPKLTHREIKHKDRIFEHRKIIIIHPLR